MTPPRFDATSTDPFAQKRERMVERQLRRRGISDERVLAAMGQVPRHRFVPDDLRSHAYRDGALRIGEGQTISQPWIVAAMTSLLGLQGHERVLEVGTGSGYGAAVLSLCCREVLTIERVPSLANRARELLRELGYDNVEVRTGDGSKGAPDRAPFEGISVTATADLGPPAALMEQLSPAGILVCPVRRGGDERLMRFHADGSAEAMVPVRFVPLVEDGSDGP
jgi:protein-L-isoaspartate(D-aspartate) O-methyltransferase